MRAERKGRAVASQHRLDLGKLDCERFLVSIDVPQEQEDQESIRAFLDDGAAWSTYSRNRERHSVLLTERELGDRSQYQCEWIVVPGSFTRSAPPRGDLWSALLALYRLSVGAVWHAHGDFISQASPKLVLPLSPFAAGALPFNTIMGYRVALIEDDRTEWSAIVDTEGEGEWRVSIHVNEYELSRDGSYRDVLERCGSIRDALMIGGNDG